MLEYLTLSVCVFLRRHTIGSICVKMPAAADFGFRANPRSAFGVERRSAARSCFIPGRNSRLHVCVMYDNTNTPTHTWEGDWERADSYDLTLSFSACRWSEWGWSLGWSRDDFLLGGLLWAFGVCILGPAETDYNLPFAFTVYVPLKLSTDASQLSVWDCPPVTNRDEASTTNSVSKLLFLTNLGCFEH